jgi:hypothetical protein
MANVLKNVHTNVTARFKGLVKLIQRSKKIVPQKTVITANGLDVEVKFSRYLVTVGLIALLFVLAWLFRSYGIHFGAFLLSYFYLIGPLLLAY